MLRGKVKHELDRSVQDRNSVLIPSLFDNQMAAKHQAYSRGGSTGIWTRGVAYAVHRLSCVLEDV